MFPVLEGDLLRERKRFIRRESKRERERERERGRERESGGREERGERDLLRERERDCEREEREREKVYSGGETPPVSIIIYCRRFRSTLCTICADYKVKFDH